MFSIAAFAAWAPGVESEESWLAWADGKLAIGDRKDPPLKNIAAMLRRRAGFAAKMALEVADRIVVMNKGRIEQVGMPDEVYDNPKNPFVFQFLGDVNLFHARTDGEKSATSESGPKIFVRPHDVEILKQPSADSIRAVIRDIRSAGALVRLELQREDTAERVDATVSRSDFREQELASGHQVFIRLKNQKVFTDDYVI